MIDTIVTFKGVTFTYEGEPNPIIRNCTFQAEEGKHLVLRGESGTGKTTLFRLLLGFEIPEEGSIRYHGQLLDEVSINQIRQETAWLPQDLNLGTGKVQDLVRFPFNFESNKSVAPSEDVIAQTFDKLGLDFSLLQNQFSDLSTGQRQRVGVAICHLLDKPLLLLDEPTSALDSASKQKVADLLLVDPKRTIISTSHDPWWIERGDTIVSLK
jgi:ABC-type bacteriocin/lantibiotic exporter with double-glycine peptidase domain